MTKKWLIFAIASAILILTGCGGGTTHYVPITDDIPPTPPANLVATPASSSQINLSWSPSTDNGGSGVSGYMIERALSSTGPFAPIALTTLTTYQDNGLAPDTTYYYRVCAYDKAGNRSGYSNIASAKTLSGTGTDKIPPTIPTNLRATALDSTRISLSWNPSTDDGGSGLAGYMLERALSQNGPFLNIATTTLTTYEDTGLDPGKTYYYRVRAYDNAGNCSDYSNIASATTLPAVDTTPPNISDTQVNPQQLDFKGGEVTITARVYDESGVDSVWAKLKKPDGNEEQIDMSLEGDYYQAKLTIPPNLRTDGKAETYQVWILAKDKKGNETSPPGIPTDGLSFSVLAPLPPPPTPDL